MLNSRPKDTYQRNALHEGMKEHAQLLSAEESAGIPLGTTPPGIVDEVSAGNNVDFPPMPVPHDQAYQDALARQAYQEANPGPTRKRRFTRNSEHFAGRMVEIMETMGLRDPVLVLMEIASGEEVTPAGLDHNGVMRYTRTPIKKLDYKTRAFAASEVLSYVYPKRKSVEVTGAEGQPITFGVVMDNAEIPVMPSQEELDRMQRERRQQAADNERTINGN